MPKTLFAITTGRPLFSRTLEMIGRNLNRYNHTNQVDVVVNYDVTYLGISDTQFTDAKIPEVFGNVTFLGAENLEIYRSFLSKNMASEETIRVLLPQEGYGNKKNAIFLKALIEQYDFVIFWDDDEYPIAALNSEAGVIWHETDIIGSHTQDHDNLPDVTCGFITGYDSPIPMNISEILSVSTARILGEALTIGTEFIQPHSFSEPENAIFLPSSVPDIKIINESRGGKWITGGNLGIRVRSLTDGYIPPYYVPDESRGDDTILSMGLQNASVVTVPSGIFHDCFQRHTEILEGQYPTSIDITDFGTMQQTQRFAKALKGWLAYSPLMIRLREGSNYSDQLDKMLKLLQQIDTVLYEEFPDLGVSLAKQPVSRILQRHIAFVERQYGELQQAKDTWFSICSSFR